MLRYVSYDVVFQEVPGEVTLAINISGCPNECKGCHSPHLQEDIGQELDFVALSRLLTRYQHAITCVCFMGGDSDPEAVEGLASFVKTNTSRIKTAWYSGKSQFPRNGSLEHFDYLKLGPYIERMGGLESPITNQRFYKIENNTIVDYTYSFTKKEHACTLS